MMTQRQGKGRAGKPRNVLPRYEPLPVADDNCGECERCKAWDRVRREHWADWHRGKVAA